MGLQAQTATQTQPPPPALPQPVFTVTVIEAAPLAGRRSADREDPSAGAGRDRDRDIERSGALDLSDFLNRRMNGVYVNEIQNNPFQPDINYRGYTASPLLGTPQGLSVYMDGVRLNQPFGEVVSWDLIPRMAIAIDDADAGIESAVRPEHARRRAVDPDQGRPATAGHHASRRSTAATCAGRSSSSTAARARTGCTGIVAGNLFGEDGWRDDSPSDVRQVFGKLGWQRPKHDARAHRGATPTTRSTATACRSRASSSATTPASTPSRTPPTTARRSSTSRRATP